MQLLSLAVEQSSEGIAVSDLDGNLKLLNHAFANMHGYSPEELIGKSGVISSEESSVHVCVQQTNEMGEIEQITTSFNGD